MNLCTDQLAMLLAEPEQLISVSFLALDPRSSAMAEEAKSYHVNHGLAEEIYLLQPDLVIAGRFSNPTTLAMLSRLDIPVAVFDPATSLEDVRMRIAEIGDILGQEDRADRLIAEYDQSLADLRQVNAHRPRAALYHANGYTSGDHSLAGQILIAAGFDNVATLAGQPIGGFMPLELLVLSEPEALITSRPSSNPSRAEDILDHPVLEMIGNERSKGSFSDQDWVCGTPHVLRAISKLNKLHLSMTDH